MGAFIDHEGTSPHAFSHAAGYLACPRTELVALSDPRAEVMDRAGERYGVAPAHRYRNYREMLESERPDIVSVATQPEQRAAIVIWAGEHGARAIYAEKPTAASLEQADAMVAAVERYGVAFNMDTNRRWETPYDTMKELIGGGRYGRLLSMTIHQGEGRPVQHGQPRLRPVPVAERRPAGGVGTVPPDQRRRRSRRRPAAARSERWRAAAVRHGRCGAGNGVAASATDSGRAFEVEVVCEQAVISSLGGDSEFLLREAGGVSHRMTRALKVSVLEYVTELTNQSTKPACLARRPPRPPPQPIGPVKPSIQRHRGRIRTSSDACDHRGQ